MLSSVLSFEKSRAESAYPTSTDIVSSMKLKISLIGVRNDDMASCAARWSSPKLRKNSPCCVIG